MIWNESRDILWKHGAGCAQDKQYRPSYGRRAKQQVLESNFIDHGTPAPTPPCTDAVICYTLNYLAVEGILNVLPRGLCGVLAANLLISLYLFGCSPAGSETAGTSDSPRVVVARVTPFKSPPVEAMGTIGFRFEIGLSFKIAGIVDTVDVDLGDTVTRGQIVATLRPVETSAQLNAAMANVAVNERTANRLRQLRASGAVSDADRDKADYEYKNALASESIARFNSDSSKILAPTNGVVLQRLGSPKEVVAAGASVLLIGDRDSGKVVRADFPARDVQNLRPGDRAVILPSNGSTAVVGTVARIAPKVDATSGGFTVEIALAPDTTLLAGDTAMVRLASAQPAQNANILQVPPLALIDTRGNQATVYVVDNNNVAHRRAVRIADITDDGVEILDGLKAGERLIVAGGAYVREGSRVQASVTR